MEGIRVSSPRINTRHPEVRLFAVKLTGNALTADVPRDYGQMIGIQTLASAREDTRSVSERPAWVLTTCRSC